MFHSKRFQDCIEDSQKIALIILPGLYSQYFRNLLGLQCKFRDCTESAFQMILQLHWDAIWDCTSNSLESALRAHPIEQDNFPIYNQKAYEISHSFLCRLHYGSFYCT